MFRFLLIKILVLGILFSTSAYAITSPLCGILATLKLDKTISADFELLRKKAVDKLIENQINGEDANWTRARGNLIVKNFVKAFVKHAGWNNSEAGAHAKALLRDQDFLRKEIVNVLDLIQGEFMQLSLPQQSAYADEILVQINSVIR